MKDLLVNKDKIWHHQKLEKIGRNAAKLAFAGDKIILLVISLSICQDLDIPINPQCPWIAKYN